MLIQIGQAIGILPTIALLILDSILGAALMRAQGRAAWMRFNGALAEGRVPGREVIDGALVIFGGALLLTPGFLSDILGLILLLPPTRAVVRTVLLRRFAGRIVAGAASGAQARMGRLFTFEAGGRAGGRPRPRHAAAAAGRRSTTTSSRAPPARSRRSRASCRERHRRRRAPARGRRPRVPRRRHVRVRRPGRRGSTASPAWPSAAAARAASRSSTPATSWPAPRRRRRSPSTSRETWEAGERGGRAAARSSRRWSPGRCATTAPTPASTCASRRSRRPRCSTPTAPVAQAGGMEGYEQLCSVTGQVRHGGRTHPVRCLGQRGHGWGTPDWSRIELARTLSAWMGADRAITLTAVRPAKAKHHDEEAVGGFLIDRGEPKRDLRPAPVDDVRRRAAPAPRGAGAVDERGGRPRAPRGRGGGVRHDGRPRRAAAGQRVLHAGGWRAASAPAATTCCGA